MLCLIIDDSKPIRGILSRMMRELGIDTIEAIDGVDALQKLEKHPEVELAWVDWNMPVMDGLTFVQQVRANRDLDALRLVMVTNESDLTHVQSAMMAGANDYVTKPFTSTDIENKLALQGLHPLRLPRPASEAPAHPAMDPTDAAGDAVVEASRRSASSAGSKQSAGLSSAKTDQSDIGRSSVSKSDQIRVLIVDDSLVVRGVVRKVLSEDPELVVADVATDGKVALEKIPTAQPDVVLLDIEMPNLNGLDTLKAIRQRHGRLPVIMFSSLTQSGARATIDALVLGADDYVHKPGGSRMSDASGGLKKIREELIPKIKQFGRRSRAVGQSSESITTRTSSDAKVPIEVVVIGVSTGGPQALATLLPRFVADCPVPVLIVQHMPPIFTNHLAERLSATGNFQAKEAEEGERPNAGTVYVAPGGYHMTVARSRDGLHLHMNQDPPENACRPAADVLFRSVAKEYGPATLAVVLTGMGQDGLNGAQQIVAAGGRVLVQDEASSVIWGMPGQVARAGIAEEILPLESLGVEIVRRVKRSRT